MWLRENSCTTFLLDNVTREETVLPFNKTKIERRVNWIWELGNHCVSKMAETEDRWNGLESEGETWKSLDEKGKSEKR